MVTTILDAITRPIHKRVPLHRTRFTPWNLRALDESYHVMNDGHKRVHEYFIGRLKDTAYQTVLEVACGTGWNIPRFRDAGLKYFGLDISETAIALAAMKYPENAFFNVSVHDCAVFQDAAFDVVYNSAMLEHIGFFESAILELVRLAKHQAVIVFFEGLSSHEQHDLKFHRWDEAELSGLKTNIFGRKLLLQDHHVHSEKGWYWNHYSQSRITDFLDGQRLTFEFFTRDNCQAIEGETVLVVSK